MAGTTVNSDLIIYNDQAQTAYLERMQDVLDVFNEASAGAIILRNELLEGDLTQKAFYQVPGGVAHRNVNSTSAAVAEKIGADEMVGVKAPWKYGPYETTEEAFKRRARSPEEFSQVIGQHMADATIDYMISAAFAGLMGAILGNANMIANGSFATDHKKVLTKGMRKFGDRFNRIAIFAMDSTTYFDLVDDAITEKVYEETGFVIYGGTPGTMGKPVLVSDKVPGDAIFGLQPGAVEIIESQPPGVRSYPVNTQENLVLGYRAEGTFNVELLGYSWNIEGSPSAPVNPNLAQLGSAANWRKYATSNKATAGVIIELSGNSPPSP
jgi:uncharacterized protein YjdB